MKPTAQPVVHPDTPDHDPGPRPRSRTGAVIIARRGVTRLAAALTVARTVRRRLVLVAGICLLLAAAGSAPAFADSASSGGDIVVAQSLGDRELTVVLRRVTSVPGPLRLDVITHTGTAPGRLELVLTPTGVSTRSVSPAPGTPMARAHVDLGAAAGMYSTTMTVRRPGPWELSIADGQRTARIPFVVPAQTTSPPDRLVYGGFLGAGILMLVTVVVAARARRTGWTLVPAGGALVGVSVAVTGAVLSASLPLPPQPGSQLDPSVDNVSHPYVVHQPLISDYSRPPAMLALDATALAAGRPADLGLDLTDGATGAPVDDLLVHDGALIHLLVVGPTGQLWHLHPIRTTPGHYQMHVTLPQPGHYALSTEFVRRGGGVQMVRAARGLDVAPGPGSGPHPPRTSAPANPVGLGPGRTTGTTVVDSTHITLTATRPVAGTPTTVTARMGDTADLQPWLGMAGHMVVAGPLPPDDMSDVGTAVQSAPVWGHVHSMGGPPPSVGSMGGMAMPGNSMGGKSMPGMGGDTDAMVGMTPVNGESAPDETVAEYGPDVPFTYSFPVPGRYRIWIQTERDFTVLTVPVVLDVAAAPGHGMP